MCKPELDFLLFVLIEWCSENLAIVKELGDRAAQGRTHGNLGNTYYLLGNFRRAVASHEQVCMSGVFKSYLTSREKH